MAGSSLGAFGCMSLGGQAVMELNANVPGFSFLTTLIAGLGAWGVSSLARLMVVGGLVGGAAAAWVGVAADLDWVVRVGVFVSAVFVGVLIGRAIPPRPTPLLLLLGLLSVVDIIWILSGGGSLAGWADSIFNFSVQFGESSASIGTFDLVLAAAVAAHWVGRGAGVWLAATAAPIGMAASNVYVAFTDVDNLALVPFIGLGWVVTEAWHRRPKRPLETLT